MKPSIPKAAATAQSTRLARSGVHPHQRQGEHRDPRGSAGGVLTTCTSHRVESLRNRITSTLMTSRTTNRLCRKWGWVSNSLGPGITPCT